MPKRGPHDAEISSVDPHTRQVMNDAQIERDAAAGLGCIEGSAIYGGATVVTDARLGPLRPVVQIFERDRALRAAPLRIERDLPRCQATPPLSPLRRLKKG
jgi:hypothetical protein